MNWPSARSSRASAPLQHDEARARELAGAGEIHHAQRLAERDMVLRRERRSRGGVPCWRTSLLRGLVAAVRHVVGRQVGQRREQRVDLGAQARRLGFEPRLLVLALGDLAQQVGGVAALRLGGADLLGEAVALGLKLLGLGLRRAPLAGRAPASRPTRRQAAPRQAAVERVGIVADPLEVEHRRAVIPGRRAASMASIAPCRSQAPDFGVVRLGSASASASRSARFFSTSLQQKIEIS